jgi:hypothetical protein
MAKKLEEQFLGYIRDELSRQTDKEIEERVESYRKKLNSIKDEVITNASLKLGTMLRVEDLSKEIRITIEKEKSNV